MATKKKPPLIPRLRGNLTANVGAIATPATPAPPKKSEAVRAERLVQRVDTLRKNIGKTFYEMGLALRELSRPEVYGSLEFKSFEALLKARKLLSKMQAGKLITIVDTFDDELLAMRYGVEKAYEVARYINLQHPGRKPEAVIRDNPVIRVGESEHRLEVISRTDLTTFVRHLLAKTDEPDDAKARIEAVARRIGQALRRLGVDPDRVRTVLSKRRGHRLRLELTADEAEDLLALIKSAEK